ncbi:unnamed protein product [Didymodactylos carnosus]|uniref:ABC transporter domain-containing protein n=1 Tax=Didymodactylos carnosus TaxID=1234261 RepID=A0A8S2Q3K7_9BILA|nr:unnamed protein product [Didymodactylos carnosus]CAF4076210.1 unnamed protein product [Didymodactylos carnosus]
MLLMLIWSALYIFLAVYVERVHPGAFGVARPWNYLFQRKNNKKIKPVPQNGLKSVPLKMFNEKWIESKPSSGVSGVSIQNLTKTFGDFKAVSNLSLDFYENEVCCLLGHNGAGKTTTTFMLVGMLEPTSGCIFVNDLDNKTNLEAVRKNIGFCPQSDILYDELTVREHLKLVAKIRQMPRTEIERSTDRILALINLRKDAQTLAKNLSGGMKRRLSIGMSLVGDPKILIFDEPTSGIGTTNPKHRREIWDVIRILKHDKENRRTIVFTTHYLDEADVLADRIAIMTAGELQAHGTPDFLKQQTGKT